jgi:hypothetical protein
MKHYADGKVRGEIDRVRQLEEIYGVSKMSPYGTNYAPIFEEILEKLEGRDGDSRSEREARTLEKLNNIARKAGVIVAADIEEQKKYLRTGFKAYQSQNPPNYLNTKQGKMKLDMRKNSSKRILKKLDRARTKSVFEEEYQTDTPESFRKLLNTYTLSDLQQLSAKAGFNPTFDRARAINTLVKAFNDDWEKRS